MAIPRKYETRACNHCGEEFRTNITQRVFCSDYCRVTYHREHKMTCWYCGWIATEKDHMFPQKFGDGAGGTVPSCKECNHIMSVRHPYDVKARMEYLVEKLVERYQLDKNLPNWTEDELNNLGSSLRAMVEAKTHARKRAYERVLHIGLRIGGLKLDMRARKPATMGGLPND